MDTSLEIEWPTLKDYDVAGAWLGQDLIVLFRSTIGAFHGSRAVPLHRCTGLRGAGVTHAWHAVAKGN